MCSLSFTRDLTTAGVVALSFAVRQCSVSGFLDSLSGFRNQLDTVYKVVNTVTRVRYPEHWTHFYCMSGFLVHISGLQRY